MTNVDRPTRVLAVISTDLRRSGATMFLVRCYSHVDSNQYAIDIWTPGILCEDVGSKWFENRGIRVIEGRILSSSSDFAKRLRCAVALRDLMTKEHYDVVHVNTGAAWLQKAALSAAVRANVPIRIAHSHCSGSRTPLRRVVQAIESHGIGKFATKEVACSDAAGEFLFGRGEWARHGELVGNGIEVSDFRFDPEVRARVRAEAGLNNDEAIVVCVGRLSKVKNQSFLVSLMPDLVRAIPGVQLWLAGDGELRGELGKNAEAIGVSSHIRFLGSIANVDELLQAADVLVMPSLSEGLGFAALEAQAAGLPCVISSGVPATVAVAGCDVRRMSPGATAEDWVIAITDAMRAPRMADAWNLVGKAGFDVRSTSEAIFGLYRN